MEFLKKNKRFSLKLDNRNIWEYNYKTNVSEDNGVLITEYCFDSGLKITNVAKKLEKYDAYEWVNYLENTSDMPSGIISELWDCDCEFPLEYEELNKWQAYFPDAKKATKVFAPTGSAWTMKEMFCDVDLLKNNVRVNHLYPGSVKEYYATGGRSSDEQAPFFNIQKNNSGYIFAVGWTGQWKCQIKRETDSVTIRSKIEDTYFRLMPGEKIRTSSIVVMAYNCDILDAHNKWRRLIKEHFSLIGKEGREKFGPLCASIWGGMSTKSVLDRIEKIKKNNLPYEYVWMDAGWYGIDTKPTPDEFEGDWASHTGDWRVSPIIHPNGLKDVSEAIHDAGMKFLLWVEPERVIRTTPVALEHPEYFLSPTEPECNNRLLNLGNPNAWDYCFKTIAGLIEELKIDCYRQDFNFAPLDYWRKNDDADRIGISEIKHINGLYRLWDSLLERFPNLIIDNCSAGGRRIDIETLRRSMPLWRSDYQCPANFDADAGQCHNLGYNSWMPYSGSGVGRIYDEYRMRSGYGGSLNVGFSFSEREEFCDDDEKIEFIRKYTDEYLRIRPYFSEDFYPLTGISENSDVWCAMQFDRPDKCDGVVQVFRRDEAPYETAVFKLKGIDKESCYRFEDIDGGTFDVSGAELSEKGLKITICEKHKAKIYSYKKINNR